MAFPFPMGPGGPPQGDPSGGAGVPGQPDNAAASAALDIMIRAAQKFIQAEQDDQDKAVVAKCLSALQGILGGRQKQNEAAMGTTPAHKAVQRASQSGPAY